MSKFVVSVFDSEEAAYKGSQAMLDLHKDGNIALYAGASAEHPPPPPELLAKLLAVQRQLRSESRERYVRTTFWRPVSLLAASVTAVGIFLGGYWLGQHQVLPGIHAAVEDSLAIRSPVAMPPEVIFQPVAADGLRGLAYSDTTGN